MATMVVSSVGASLLTNLAPDNDTRTAVREATNLRSDELSDAQRERFDALEEQARARLRAADAAEQRRACAELAVLVPLADELRDERVTHWLVHSATDIGARAARLLREHLEGGGCQVQLFGVEDLRTITVDEFQIGLANLARWSTETLPAHRAAGDRVLFNVAGGFKTLSGYLQVLGMFHADQTIYTFEGTNELLRVPRLPVRLDISVEQAQALRQVRLASADLALAAVAVPESLVLVINDEVGGLSAYGELIWEQAVDAGLYAEQLLPSPHPRLRYADLCRHPHKSAYAELRIMPRVAVGVQVGAVSVVGCAA